MKFPLKLIEWHDAYNGEHNWIKLNELSKEQDPCVIQTIGFEVIRTEKYVTLAMSVTNNEQVCDLFTIPLAIVVREQTFRNRG